jgi:hypothetical protein
MMRMRLGFAELMIAVSPPPRDDPGKGQGGRSIFLEAIPSGLVATVSRTILGASFPFAGA